MRIRTRLSTFVITAVVACGGISAPALAATHSSSCTSKSSAAAAYGGQGNEITQVGCQPGSSTPPSTPTASSSLPFTGLDIGLLVAAGAVLVTAGMVLRWRLRHEEK